MFLIRLFCFYFATRQDPKGFYGLLIGMVAATAVTIYGSFLLINRGHVYYALMLIFIYLTARLFLERTAVRRAYADGVQDAKYIEPPSGAPPN
jgi:hypothetical protein